MGENAREEVSASPREAFLAGDARDDVERGGGRRQVIREDAVALVVAGEPGPGARAGGDRGLTRGGAEPLTREQEGLAHVKARERGRGQAPLVGIRLVERAVRVLDAPPEAKAGRQPLDEPVSRRTRWRSPRRPQRAAA